jgi:hypothetical protein
VPFVRSATGGRHRRLAGTKYSRGGRRPHVIDLELTMPDFAKQHGAARRRELTTALLVIMTIAVGLGTAGAQQHPQPKAAEQNPRWVSIRRVFGQGDVEGDYFRINLPRTDLHVRIGDVTLDPGLELTSYVGFMPTAAGQAGVMAMGEVVARQDEVPAVLAEARRQGVRITAVHNHLLDELPRIMYLHVMTQGEAAKVASAMRAVFAATATPLAPGRKEASSTDWSAVDAILGTHSEAEGPVAEYVFQRRERLTVHGMAVKSVGTLETASEVVFQRLGGGRVATVGELYLLPAEVDPVLRTLGEHGLHVTALHNHMLDDGPPRLWVHWYTTGDAATLARGIAATLAHMNSARKAMPEGGE